jgi:hypothetical protein
MPKHSMNEMTSIQSEFTRRYSELPGLLGVGIGRDETTGDYQLKVYVQSAAVIKKLPRSFHNVPVSIDVTTGAVAY